MIESFLLSRSFYVNIENYKSFIFQLTFFIEFLKDPSLVLYSSSYIPLPLCPVISISAANRHIYDDNKQLF